MTSFGKILTAGRTRRVGLQLELGATLWVILKGEEVDVIVVCYWGG